MHKLHRLHIAVLCLVFLATSVMACQVPVFRYALERWQADKYEVLIIHDGQLDASSQSLLARLQDSKLRGVSNFEVRATESSQLKDKRLQTLWNERTETDQPLMVVLYPRTAREVPDRVIEGTRFTEETISQLVQSPARQQLAKRLSSGESAVWVFVPSGIKAKDAAALKMLNDRIAVNRERLTLPTAEELDIDPTLLAKNKIPLRIDFSVVTLDIKDARESFLLRSLLKSEADLDAAEPLAFPVFGRGRVLYALVGEGIMPETLDIACQFMAGPCSCQVKNQNPGFDLLLSFDWDAAVADSLISAALPDESVEPKLLTIPPGQPRSPR